MTTLTARREQIERIQTKLAQVRRAQPGVFGSGAHRYALGKPISERELSRFEAHHGIVLPGCYREFITQVGYGGRGRKSDGAGPYYGLYRLDRWDDYPSWIFDDAGVDWLARGCPLKPGRNALPELTAEEEDAEDWPPQVVDLYRGILTIGTRGCTYMTGLVVTGEARGRVVYLDAQQCEAPYVGRDVDFLYWYERWLDELLGGYKTTWFGYGPAGDETQLLAIISETDDAEMRAEAITNLGKVPARSSDVWSPLFQFREDGSAVVRHNLAWLLRFAPRAVLADFESFFDDADPKVRKQAYMSFVDAAADAYGVEVARRADEETDAEAQRAARVVLRGAGLLE